MVSRPGWIGAWMRMIGEMEQTVHPSYLDSGIGRKQVSESPLRQRKAPPGEIHELGMSGLLPAGPNA